MNLKTFYLQVNQATNLITDAIEYPYDGYIAIQLDSLPAGVNGGWFKLESGVIVEYPELKPISPGDEIETLKAELEQVKADLVDTQVATDFILFSQMPPI